MRGGPINTRRVVIPNTNNSRNASGGEAVGSANNIEDINRRNAVERSINYMGLEPNQNIRDIKKTSH